MPGADWWDEVEEPVDYTGFDAAEKIFGRENVQIGNWAADSELLHWLCNMLRGHDLWMDGTMHWNLPLSVLSGIRARTALDAITEAKRRYDEWAAKSQESSLPILPTGKS